MKNMFMWEYDRLSISNKTPEEVLNLLNVCGKDKWEIIQYVENNATSFRTCKDSNYVILMKRQISGKNFL